MIPREKIGIGKNHVRMLTTSADECLINSSPTCAQLSPGCKISNKTDRIDSLSLRLFLYARGTMCLRCLTFRANLYQFFVIGSSYQDFF